MHIQYLIAFTAIFVYMLQPSVSFYIPESSSTAKASPLALRQEGYTYCVSQPAGTCIIAYIIYAASTCPLDIQLLSNDCQMAIGGKRHMERDASPDDVQTSSLVTSPVTKFSVKYIADDEPAEIKADGHAVVWNSANRPGKTIWTGTFACHLKTPSYE
ncbi:hypothetical protein EYC80_000822 [Monilinia laxa]|uniref:Uncharacterized protein n=1 Tax=Monilinia laxa TaxID=61186 RepID=A0A5N6K7E5_MONLA|nr:hypothetical protein EYC80_000822 [Monilinia laxa]